MSGSGFSAAANGRLHVILQNNGIIIQIRMRDALSLGRFLNHVSVSLIQLGSYGKYNIVSPGALPYKSHQNMRSFCSRKDECVRTWPLPVHFIMFPLRRSSERKSKQGRNGLVLYYTVMYYPTQYCTFKIQLTVHYSISICHFYS